LVICSNNVFVLRRFSDITTFTVYVTDCILRSLSIFTSRLSLQATYAYRLMHTLLPSVWEWESFKS